MTCAFSVATLCAAAPGATAVYTRRPFTARSQRGRASTSIGFPATIADGRSAMTPVSQDDTGVGAAPAGARRTFSLYRPSRRDELVAAGLDVRIIHMVRHAQVRGEE
jgi:hypothetical protein